MSTFAERLRDNIENSRELDRLTDYFRRNPDVSCETTLSHAEAERLGFEVYSSQRDGVFVSLPRKNYGQFGDH